MELTPKQQTIELIKNSNRILVTTHVNPDGDALGSAVALYLTLKKIGKDVTVANPDNVPMVLSFLPSIGEISKDLTGTKDFIITLDCSQTQVEKLGYKNAPEEKKLNIILTPKSGSFEPKNVSFGFGAYKYDLIFVLDSPDLDRLGKFFENQPQLFYETPIINIDHHPGNDYFGKVNWVDLTATSTSEILVSLFESLGRDKSLLDADIATCLLTGITTDTGSFQNSNTTPKSFTVAAQLVAAGGRQQEIIQKIYKTKPLTTLKLWGKVLSKIYEDPEHRFVWSTVTTHDLKTVGADDTETAGVIDELLKTVPDVDFVLLLSEKKGGIHGSFRTIEKGIDVSELAKIFDGGGHQAAAAFHMPNANLAEAENEILSKVREFQERKLKARQTQENNS